MDLQMLQQFFMWATILNFAILMLWSVVLMFASDFVFGLHSKWFSLTREAFDNQIYGFLAMAKIVFVMFFLVPWLALLIIG